MKEEDSEYSEHKNIGIGEGKDTGLLSSRLYGCNSKHGKRCSVFGVIIYRTLLTKKLYMVCFCHSNRLWHVPVRLSILFISVSGSPSKTDFKELPVMRGRTWGNIWKNKWLMASLLSPVAIMQNLQCLCEQNGKKLEYPCISTFWIFDPKCINITGHKLKINLTAWLNRNWWSMLILTTHLTGSKKELMLFLLHELWHLLVRGSILGEAKPHGEWDLINSWDSCQLRDSEALAMDTID